MMRRGDGYTARERASVIIGALAGVLLLAAVVALVLALERVTQ